MVQLQEIFHLVTAGSSLTLPLNIDSRRTLSHAWGLKFQGKYFCDTQGITEIHKNIISWKFGAIQYI